MSMENESTVVLKKHCLKNKALFDKSKMACSRLAPSQNPNKSFIIVAWEAKKEAWMEIVYIFACLN